MNVLFLIRAKIFRMSDAQHTGSSGKAGEKKLTGYEKACLALNMAPNAQAARIAREFEEDEKKLLKQLYRNSGLYPSSVHYMEACRTSKTSPNPMAVEVLKELDEEKKAKANQNQNKLSEKLDTIQIDPK